MGSYTSIVQMAGSPSLLTRVAAAAAQEGSTDGLAWAQANIWTVVAKDTGWGDAWQYAVDSGTVNVNPDTGMRDDVITDQMILSVVQPMVKPEQAETVDTAADAATT